jgi:hypothetical protein
LGIKELAMRGIDIVIEPDFPLDETAKRISRAIGVSLLEELTGRYEEFPAFTAHRVGVEYALLGVPATEHDIRDEPTNDYCFSVVPSKGTTEPEVASELLAALRLAGLRVELVK